MHAWNSPLLAPPPHLNTRTMRALDSVVCQQKLPALADARAHASIAPSQTAHPPHARTRRRRGRRGAAAAPSSSTGSSRLLARAQSGGFQQEGTPFARSPPNSTYTSASQQDPNKRAQELGELLQEVGLGCGVASVVWCGGELWGPSQPVLVVSVLIRAQRALQGFKMKRTASAWPPLVPC